jgi:hypothetical protein
MEENTTKQRKVIHLEINGQHHYFGSVSAMYQEFDRSQLGISRKTLYYKHLSPDNPFTNSKCTIREGVLKLSANYKKKKLRFVRII